MPILIQHGRCNVGFEDSFENQFGIVVTACVYLPAPIASRMRETINGAMPCPESRTDGIAPQIMMIWDTPQIRTPIKMVLNLPSFVSAIQPPKIGIT